MQGEAIRLRPGLREKAAARSSMVARNVALPVTVKEALRFRDSTVGAIEHPKAEIIDRPPRRPRQLMQCIDELPKRGKRLTRALRAARVTDEIPYGLVFLITEERIKRLGAQAWYDRVRKLGAPRGSASTAFGFGQDYNLKGNAEAKRVLKALALEDEARGRGLAPTKRVAQSHP